MSVFGDANVRTEYWMFTLNNPTDQKSDDPKEMRDIEYLVYQLEKGENETPHYQGYVVFRNRKQFQWVRKQLPRAAWFSRKGNHEQAKHYCEKPVQGCQCEHCRGAQRLDGPWHVGVERPEPEQGKRNDLKALKRALDSGATEAAIAADPELFPVWARHHKVCSRYRTLTGKQRDWPVFTQVIWGAPGLGKTRKALELAGPAAYWLPRPAGTTSWFDGYIGQETIVIDEFYGWLSLDLLCRILDRYPYQVETKGGSTPLLVKKVIITSNVPPLQWYPKMTEQRLGALWRRLQMPLGTVEHMITPWVPPPAPEVQNGVLQQPLLYADEEPLWADELGGDHLGPLVPFTPPAAPDPEAWIDVVSGVPGPFYGAQR
uniref:ATP-dependent helicase Rep n=1 Tax=uncultured virus TaxID=340016 RepID=A0A1D8MJV0_9VIRU|nr:putative rep protein [uncultured virus]